MKVKLDTLKPNEKNPRYISEDKMADLEKSLKDFPKMMELRPIVVDDDNTILGGNMRYEALKRLGFKDVPDKWVIRAKLLTEEQKKEFIIKDNLPFGSWDWDILANEWDDQELSDWGMTFDFPDIEKVDLDMEDGDQTKTFTTTVMILRNIKAGEIQKKKDIPMSEAYLEAEDLILKLIREHTFD